MKRGKKMKNMKKRVLSLLAVVAMLVTLMAPTAAMADTPTGGLLITNTHGETTSISGETFNVYKVFNVATDGAGDEQTFIYTLTAPFANLSTDLGYDVVAELTGTDKTIGEIAADIRAYVATKSIAPTDSATVEAGAESVMIEDLEFGYYLVLGNAQASGGSVVANAALVSVEHDSFTKVYVKTDAPKITKKVWDDTDNNGEEATERWQDVADVNIGDTVKFKLESTLPDLSNFPADFEYTYIMHDKMSAGLTLDPDSFEVILGGEVDGDSITGGTTLVEDTDYEIKIKPATHASDCTFEIDFLEMRDLSATVFPSAEAPDSIDWPEDPTPIYVVYEADLNSNAVVYDPGNPNAVTLQYSNSPYATTTNTTPEDKVVVYTFGIDLVKYTGGTVDGVYVPGEGILNGETVLAGAEFKLYSEAATEESRTAIQFVRTAAGSDSASATYRLALSSETGTSTLISPASGRIEIVGLDEGMYYLSETKAPNGYSLLEEDMIINMFIDYAFDEADGYTGAATDLIADQGTYWGVNYKGDTSGGVVWEPNNAETEGDHYIKVRNVGGSKLPETGGIGTTLFIFGGMALVLVAGTILAIRRKAVNK